MTPAEHFAWAKAQALEYVDAGDPVLAISSLISDLNKHEGTADILHPPLIELLFGELRWGGRVGVRRFIQGIPAPPAGMPVPQQETKTA